MVGHAFSSQLLGNRKVDLSEYKASLICTPLSRPARAIQEDPDSKEVCNSHIASILRSAVRANSKNES